MKWSYEFPNFYAITRTKSRKFTTQLFYYESASRKFMFNSSLQWEMIISVEAQNNLNWNQHTICVREKTQNKKRYNTKFEKLVCIINVFSCNQFIILDNNFIFNMFPSFSLSSNNIYNIVQISTKLQQNRLTYTPFQKNTFKIFKN